MKIALLVTLLAAGHALAQTAEKPRGYEAFQFARTRNIFDPSRLARSEPSRGPQPPARTRQNFLMLTGTMVTEGKTLAFFNGGSADSNKVAAVGETVSGYKIAAINPEQVQLEKAGNTTTLAVGKQLTLEGMVALPPGPETAAEPAAGTAPGAPPSSPAPASTPPASAPAGGGDVLKRMMERRQQEMSK